MDNRKVFRSYRDKTREAASPYSSAGRERGGLFSKVKLFFTPVSIWNSNETPNDSAISESNMNSLKPFSFNGPDSTIIGTPSRSISGTNQPLQLQPPLETPNKVLSSFFEEKGDKPLTEIEYEGVKSLLAKARSESDNTLNDSSVIFRGDGGVDKPFEPASESTAHNQTNETVLKSEPLNSTTAYNQTTLKSGDGQNSPAVFSTPDYRPAYHNVNNSFTSKNMPSVKRVYHFSGLPSPYRTRIKAPSFSKTKRPPKISPNNTISNNSSYISTSKPISNTANTLLNILDGNTSENVGEIDNSMKKFSNPYSQTIKKRKPVEDALTFSENLSSTPTKKKANIITAEDISKTVSFNKYEELPKESKKSDKKTNDDEQSSASVSEFNLFGSSRPAKSISNIIDNSNTSSTSQFDQNSKNVTNNGAKKNTEKQNGTINGNLFPLAASKPHTNGKENKENSIFGNSMGGTNFKITPNDTANDAISQKDNDINITSHKFADEFIFPVSKATPVSLDLSKVEQNKALFDF